jgi:hypothetical protein
VVGPLEYVKQLHLLPIILWLQVAVAVVLLQLVVHHRVVVVLVVCCNQQFLLCQGLHTQSLWVLVVLEEQQALHLLTEHQVTTVL